MDRFGYTVFGLQALRRLKGGLLAERNLSLPFVFTNAGESLNCRPNLTFWQTSTATIGWTATEGRISAAEIATLIKRLLERRLVDDSGAKQQPQ